MRGSVWAVLLACAVAHGQAAPQNPASQPAIPSGSPAPNAVQAPGKSKIPEKPVKQPTGSERRRAAKLYLDAARLYAKGQFEEALGDDRQAAALDPTNGDYALAMEVARAHAVTSLVQAAAKARTQGDVAAARSALTHALELDPGNQQVLQHLDELGDELGEGPAVLAADKASESLGGFERLAPRAGTQSFHLHTNAKDLIQRVYRAYGIEATVDDSVRQVSTRFDLDDATFAQAVRAVEMVTDSFHVTLDPHRVLQARDTRENRAQYTRNGEETVYLAGMTTTEMTDIGNMARSVFEIQGSVDQSAGTITLRAPESKLAAFNATFRSLMDGKSQVLLDVKLLQLAHTSTRNTGVTPPQQVTAFNVYAQEQSILNQNQALVQQIISSGLAAPGDTLTIIGILLASGQVSSSLLSNGVVLFGGGLTLSGLTPKPFSVNLALNSSDSRELDLYQLRLEDGQDGTLRSGTRYPIEQSSFSSLGGSSLSIPGLTGAGNSSSLSSILSSLSGASTNIPMIQYEDLGLTMKATPRVMRSGDVAITLDTKISALAGSSVNGVPVLANRAWSGVVTVPHDQAVVVASEIDKNESRAISGVPGLSEIPGLNNVTDKDVETNSSTLLVIITPHVIRSPHVGGHTQMVRIEHNLPAR